MKITFWIKALVVEEGTDNDVPPPVGIDGWRDSDPGIALYFDPPLADAGIIGGEISAAIIGGQPQIVVTYWAPGLVDDDKMRLLEEYTRGQMSDGAGECGFPITIGAIAIRLIPDSDGPIACEQSDDGHIIPPASRIAIAARDGNLADLNLALKERLAGIDDLLMGCTALYLAICFGHFEAARILIANGADPNKCNAWGGTPLKMCALQRDLPDALCAKLASLLLLRGADPRHVESNGETALSYAILRGKPLLAKVLEHAT